MQHKGFRQISELSTAYQTYVEAYAALLQSESIPPSLMDDNFPLQQQASEQSESANTEVS